MILKAEKSMDSEKHPEGLHPGVCVDVIDLGNETVEYQGKPKTLRRVRLTFEMEQTRADGTRWLLSKKLTASLHPKSRLSEVIGKWRGRKVEEGEELDLNKLVGQSATLLVSNVDLSGRVVSVIDLITKPQKKVTPSGTYDPEAAREKIAKRQMGAGKPEQAGPGREEEEEDVEVAF